MNEARSAGRINRWLDDKAARVGGWRAVLFFFLIYGVIHGAVTRLAGPALALDDVKINLVTQSLQGGYMQENPPLFEWLLIGVQQFVGPGAEGFLVVKYGLLCAMGVAAYLTFRQMKLEPAKAGVGAVSLLLVYQIGWNYHQAFTHSTALIAATAFFWLTFAKLTEHGRIGDFVLFGVAIGLGGLSKYSFLICLVLALGAGFSIAAVRQRLVSLSMLIALAVASVMLAPHLVWIMGENAEIAQSISARFDGEEKSYWRKVASGGPQALWAIMAFFLPLGLVCLGLMKGRARGALFAVGDAPLDRLFQRAGLLGAAALVGSVFAFGLDGMQERYALPFLYPLAIVLIYRFLTLADRQGQERFVLANIACLAAILALRVGQTLVAGPPFCEECRQWVPYDDLGKAIVDMGLKNETLVGFEDHTAGNLRRLFPKTRVISAHIQYYTPPTEERTKCVFIWSPDLGPPAPEHVTNAYDSEGLREISVPWHHPLKPEGWRETRWFIGTIDGTPVQANDVCRFSSGTD